MTATDGSSPCMAALFWVSMGNCLSTCLSRPRSHRKQPPTQRSAPTSCANCVSSTKPWSNAPPAKTFRNSPPNNCAGRSKQYFVRGTAREPSPTECVKKSVTTWAQLSMCKPWCLAIATISRAQGWASRATLPPVKTSRMATISSTPKVKTWWLAFATPKHLMHWPASFPKCMHSCLTSLAA